MSPLSKRFPREFKNGLGKHVGLFALMVVAISLTTGFLAAAASIETMLVNMRDDYRVEDGSFTANFKLDDAVVEQVEDLGLTLYRNYSYDVPLDIVSASGEAKPAAAGAEGDIAARIYATREGFDESALAEGAKPSAADEVALDRVFAANRGLEVGDSVDLGGSRFTVSGIVTLPDYQALFERNSDFLFNAVTFSVGEVTPEGFDRLHGRESFTYSFLFDDRGLSADERADVESDIVDVLEENDIVLSDFIDCDAKRGIGYALDDVVSDQVMWRVLFMIIIVIMAFVFVVLTSGVIEAESAVIGTLLASGYRKRELVLHYLTMPAIVGATGAAVGNIAGYALFTDSMRELYYNSYSIPPFQNVFSPSVFVLTTLVPFALLVGITVIGLVRKLNRTPLQFLRHDVSARSVHGTVRLPERLGFSSRFRLRVFFRNIGNFVTLFFGIMFASLLLVFGLCMAPIVSNHADNLRNSLVSEHQYSLKAPLELEGTPDERAAYAAAHELSERVDLGSIDEDAAQDALEDFVKGRVESRIDDFFRDNFDPTALMNAIAASGGTGYVGGINVQKMLSGTGVDAYDVGALYEDAGDLDVEALVRAGILRDSMVDLTDCGLGVVDLATFDVDDVDEDDFDIASIDFEGASLEQLGLGGADLGGLTLGEFFTLVDRASDIDEDAHPVNTMENADALIGQAEKFAAGTLEVKRTFGGEMETVTVYGIQEGSRYWDIDVGDGRVVVGQGLAEKCALEAGKGTVFRDKYAGKSFELVPSATWGTVSTMYVLMSLDSFNELFDNETDYFNGYVSDEALAIDDYYLVNDLTPSDMDKIGTQMKSSMGYIMDMLVVVAVLIYLILMYLLTKTVIERSARSIAYMKVFGYRDSEINRLYVRSISTTVIVSLFACLPLLFWSLSLLMKLVFSKFTGNFEIVFTPDVILKDLAFGIATYCVVAFLHVRRIKRVPFSEALKVQE